MTLPTAPNRATRFSAIALPIIFLSASTHALAIESDQFEDHPYFGIEVLESANQLVTAWVDPEHRTARKLNERDVIITVDEQSFYCAEDLLTFLTAKPIDARVRFDVLGAADRKPRTVFVRGESLRAMVPRWFSKVRDRERHELLFLPKSEGERLHVPVTETFADRDPGLRLLFLAGNDAAENGGVMQFTQHMRRSASEDDAILKTAPDEFRFLNVSETDAYRIPLLSQSQRYKLERHSCIEIGSKRSKELFQELTKIAALPGKVRVNALTRIYLTTSGHRLTAAERRNIRWCLLYYQLLQEEAAANAADQP